MKLSFGAFQGMRPAVSPKLIEANMATLAQDLDLSRGYMEPLQGVSAPVATLGKTGTIKTLYRMHSGTWLHWYDEVSVAPIPIANNELERIIFTGTDKPRMTDAVKALGSGGDNWPEVSYWAGIPAPDQILETDASTTASDDDLARVYTYTYVTAWGEEGPPADPSQIYYTQDGATVTLSNFAGMPAGPYQITAVRVYRALTGTSGSGEYLFVAEIPLPVTTWADMVSDANLGSELTTTIYSASDESMQGVVAMANGMLAGYFDNMLCLSEPYQGHAWPEDYRIPMEDEITGIASAGNMLYVATKASPYMVVGNHPTVMGANKLETVQTLVSPRSLVDMGSGAMYAAADGLVWVSGEGAKLVTHGVLHPDDWAAYNPSSIHGYLYRNQYLGFYDSGGVKGGFLFDPATQTFQLLSTWASAGFSDQSTGKLYLAQGGAVVEFDGGSTLTGVWESKHTETFPTTFTAAKVDADAFPVTFKLYADGVLKHTQSVTSDNPFRLPGGYRARTWVVRIETTQIVHGVFLASTVAELR